MLRAAFGELRARRVATALSALGLLAATVGFALLAITSKTTEATLHGDITTTWDTPYDLLVLPHGTQLGAMRGDNAVQPNALSTLAGGITTAQLDRIRKVAGVAVAAPVADVGYLDYGGAAAYESLAALPRQPGLTVYRIRGTTTADAGMSHIPGYTDYVALPDGENLWQAGATGGARTVFAQGTRLRCSGDDVVCYGGPPPTTALAIATTPPPMTFRRPYRLMIPVVGIDPEAEAQLYGVNRCVTNGRYLNATDVPANTTLAATSGFPGAQLASIPVLVNGRPEIQDQETLQVDVADDSGPLITPGGALDDNAFGALHQWRQVATWTLSFRSQFGAYFLGEETAALPATRQIADLRPPIAAGRTGYTSTSADHLDALAVHGDATSVYSNNPFVFPRTDVPPAAASDTWFRSLDVHTDQDTSELFAPLPANNASRVYKAVGTFDPACTRYLDLTGSTGLDLYSYGSHGVSNGAQLRPSDSIASYVGGPPLFLTTLSSAQYFADEERFADAPGDAFISVIRVRASGVADAGPVSEARLARIAADIHSSTGLDVDVVKGTSPKPVQVDLPAGDFGRRATTVSESWAVLGAGYRFDQQLAPQNAALFGLVLVAAGILTGQTTFTAVRRRRRELALLRALGWPRSRIGMLIELETVLVGIGVGLLGVAIAALLSWRMHVDPATARVVLLVLPLAVLIAALAGIVPAISAARRGAIQVMQGRGRVRRSHPRFPQSLIAARELLTTWRMEAVLGALAIAVGASLLGGVVLVEVAFRGTLDTTILGRYLSAEVQPFHIALGAIALLIGLLASSQILLLSYLERLPHMATLRALGWPRSRVGGYVAMQAGLLGFLGGVVAAGAVVGAGILSHASTGGIVTAAATGASVAVLGGLVAAVAPVAMIYRRSVADALAE
jgi:putative ABC transport system permease protein